MAEGSEGKLLRISLGESDRHAQSSLPGDRRAASLGRNDRGTVLKGISGFGATSPGAIIASTCLATARSSLRSHRSCRPDRSFLPEVVALAGGLITLEPIEVIAYRAPPLAPAAKLKSSARSPLVFGLLARALRESGSAGTTLVIPAEGDSGKQIMQGQAKALLLVMHRRSDESRPPSSPRPPKR